MCVSNACDAYSDTWNNHYDIYDFLGDHIHNKQTKKIGSGTFAVCKNHGTRQRFELCRVPRLHGTRQIFGHVIVPGWLLYFAVDQEWHTANPLPCARYIAHGKGQLCRCLVAVCALSCAAHGKGFAVGFWGFTVCQGHTAKVASPVVSTEL